MPYMPYTSSLPNANTQQLRQRQQRLLQLLEIKSSVFYVGQHCGAWRSSPPHVERCAFHIVLAGDCLWRSETQSEPSTLEAGEGLIFLQPLGHELLASPRSLESVQLICGYVEFTTPFSPWILRQLPEALSFSAQQPQLGHLFALLKYELATSLAEPSNLLLHKLCELLVCYVLEEALSATVDTRTYGLVSLVQDSTYAVVLDALWHQPQLPWDTAQMAELVHSSPASFHRRFKLLTGMGPAQFLLLIRVFWAQQYLNENDSLETIAEKVGYGSASALSHAFKRQVGLTPAQWRQQHQLRHTAK